MMSNTKFQSVDEYISAFPQDVQVLLEAVRNIIRREASDAVETIAYHMPTFKLHGKNLVHFAGYKNHIGFYPVPSGIEAFKKDLSSYKQGKGSVQFPIDKPLPLALIRKIVKFRVKENEEIKKRYDK